MRTRLPLFFFSLTISCGLGSGCWEELPQMTGLSESEPRGWMQAREQLAQKPVAQKQAARRGPRYRSFELKAPAKLDLLFVVDNSSTMGGRQGRLAQGISSLVSTLRSPELDADLRIAVTSTDMGGPERIRGCQSSDAGELLYTSCLDRPEAFVSVGREFSRFNTACASHCALDTAALQTKRNPTNGARDKWLAFGTGKTNLVNQDTEIDEALACLLPLGINGCGFEHPLDAMRAALEKGSAPGAFLRDDASLAVIHVTDELDCSMNTEHPEFQGIYFDTVFGQFSQDFWVPGQNKVASASCFMAGAHCEAAEQGPYLSCQARNWDLDRKPLAQLDAYQSVLRPISAYQTQLEEIRRHKRAHNPNATVFVGLIGGVDASTHQVVYRDGLQGGTKERELYPLFGLGFGCEGTFEFLDERDPLSKELVKGGAELSFAFPPIRIRALMDEINGAQRPGYTSICAEDWGPSLTFLARQATKHAGRSCAQGWVADKAPNRPEFVPDCQVVQLDAKGKRVELSECQKDRHGYLREKGENRFVPPAGEESCYLALTDNGEEPTLDPYDDMSFSCLWSSNVEFRVIRKSGSREHQRAEFRARCRMWEGK